MGVAALGTLLLALTAPAAETLEDAAARHGRLIVTSFVSVPFPHPSRAAGRIVVGYGGALCKTRSLMLKGA